MKTLKVIVYAFVGALLSVMGYHALGSWQFWAIMLSLGAADVLSSLIQAAEEG